MGKFSSGLFWGAVFGGLAGLMNAPAPGRVTRKKIKGWIDTTTDDVNDVRYKLDNLALSIHRLANEGLASVNQSSHEIQASLSRFQDEVEPRIRRVKGHMEILSQDLEKFSKNDEDSE